MFGLARVKKNTHSHGDTKTWLSWLLHLFFMSIGKRMGTGTADVAGFGYYLLAECMFVLSISEQFSI